jgi:arylsulfatase A-like enzyme/sugar lactone lactonase YvrE
MSYRAFLWVFGCLVVDAMMAPFLLAYDAAPNIVFLMVDDMGWGDAGCYGQKWIQTPNIDKLAKEGMRFTNVYAGASVCAPSRSVLMTGQHLGHTRIRGNAGMVGGVGNERRVPLEPEDITVASLLKQAGYATGMTGKWGLAEPETEGLPNKKGFDEFFGYLNQKHAHNYYPEYLWKNTERVTLNGNLNGQSQVYSHDLFADFSLDFVRRHQDESFFLYLPWTMPHAKYVVPSLETYADKDWPEEYKVHAAMITRLDRDLGRLMALLKELNLDDRTIVFFCSDNGGVERRDGVLDSVGPFRGKKGMQTEGGLRVPMIVRWPKRIAAGAVSDATWNFVDVLPTLCEIGKAGTPPGIDGISVLPTLLGSEQMELKGRKMYWEQYSGGFQQAVRWGKWKGHLTQSKDKFELYDLNVDPTESNDIAGRHPEVVQEIRKFMITSHVPSPNWITNPTSNGEDLFMAKALTSDGSFTEGIEGPACDRNGNLYAVNFERQQTVGRIRPNGEGEVFMTLSDTSVGNGIRFDRNGIMYVADYVGHNIIAIDPKTKDQKVYAHDARMNQPNDIAIASDGTLYASDPNWKSGTGQLWRIDRDGTTHLIASEMGTTNGIDLSPDGRRLYVNESVQRKIWVMDITDDKRLANKRLLREFEDYGFDGMRVDIDGNLYVTRHGKGTVVKLSQRGEILREIDVLGSKPSNLCFGGPDGRTVYVTEVEHRRVVSFRVDRPGLEWSRR